MTTDTQEWVPIEKPYLFHYHSRSVEIVATSLYQAKLKAIEHFKPPKSKEHMVHGALKGSQDFRFN